MSEYPAAKVATKIGHESRLSLKGRKEKIVIGGDNSTHYLDLADFGFSSPQVGISRDHAACLTEFVVGKGESNWQIIGVYLSEEQDPKDPFTSGSWNVSDEEEQVTVGLSRAGQAIVMQNSRTRKVLAIEALGEKEGSIEELGFFNEWSELATRDRKVWPER